MEPRISRNTITKKQFWIVAFAVLGTAITIFGIYTVISLGIGISPSGFLATIPIVIFLFSMITIVLLWVFKQKFLLSWKDLGFTIERVRPFHLLWQIPSIFILLLLVQLVFIVLFFGASPAESQTTDELLTFSTTGKFLFIISTAVLTPLWEETFFRGFLWNRLSRLNSALAVISLSAVIFALCHAVPILLPYMLTLGFSLGYLRWFHGSILPGIFFHILLNSIVVIGAVSDF